MVSGSSLRRFARAAWPAGAALALAAAAPASGDEILMRNGGRIEGVVVEQTANAVVFDTSPGRVTLPLSRVARIVRGPSALDRWRAQASALHARDSRGWATLARWAQDVGLGTQAAEAWQRVLAVDPQNAEANRALGRVAVDGAWLGEDDAYRARGYVPFEGRWVSPAEHELLVRERAAEEAAELLRREATVRLREADARAREAEARAREAEAVRDLGPVDEGGIPFGYAYGGYGPAYGYGTPAHGGYGYGHGGPAEPHPDHGPGVSGRGGPSSTPPTSLGDSRGSGAARATPRSRPVPAPATQAERRSNRR